MTDYVKSTNFASKDALATGNPLKIVKGTEIDTEFNNISVAVVTKANLNSPTFTGDVTGTFVGNITGNATTATTATTATSLATTGFSIVESGGKLIFKYGTTTIASMTSAGVITALGNISAGGTP